MSEPRVLLTGFEPFGADATNPSGDVLEKVAALWDGPEELHTALLPVVFGVAAEEMDALIEAHRPTVVVALGLAAGRSAITPERVAVNLDDARIADNAGAQPCDLPVVADGPAAYFSTLPVKAVTAALGADDLPAALSHTAGSFVCNHVFYRLQHLLAATSVRSGFVHVPDTAVLGLDDLARGVRLILRTALDTPRDVADLARPGGILA